MSNHVAGKSIVITGAGSGFGKLVSERVAAVGASTPLPTLSRAPRLTTQAASVIVLTLAAPISSWCQTAVQEPRTVDVCREQPSESNVQRPGR